MPQRNMRVCCVDTALLSEVLRNTGSINPEVCSLARNAAILNVALHKRLLTPVQVAVLLYIKTGGQVDRYFTSR